MIQLIGKNRSRVWTMLSAVFLLLVCLETAWAAPLLVRVQPSGDSFAKAYVITGEARSYFGNVEGGTGPYQYKWEFTDGAGDTGFQTVSNPRYIAYDGKVFDSAGTKFARLTVRDSGDPQMTASATINLQVLSVAEDDLVRQKNSAVDRGLRQMYLLEVPGQQGSYWPGSGQPIGSTGMALVALENHGHKLHSPDSDIYKKSVQEGIRFLLNNANTTQISDSPCTGDPEANDGDSDNDNLGVTWNTHNMYQEPIALLALLNSTDKASAQSTVAQTTGGGVNGMTYWDIAVDAKDFLVYAQGEGMSGTSLYAGQGNYYVDGRQSGSDVTTLYGYVYSPSLATLGCGGSYSIAWGDGTTTQTTETGNYCPYYYGDGYAMFGDAWGGSTISHHYAAAGTYTITITYTDQAGHKVTFPANPIATVVSGGACSGTYAAGRGAWRYSPNDSSADNSVAQWPVLALSEAANTESGWGIGTNPLVKTELSGWLAYSQNANGGFGYESPSSWVNFPKTAAGAIMLKYLDKPQSDAAVQNAFNYIDGAWGGTGMDGNLGNMYSMYAFYKSMKLWGIGDFKGRAWENLYTQQLVGTQQASNIWYDQGPWEDSSFATYTAIAILAPEIAKLPPVANAGGPYPQVNANQSVALNGGASYHRDADLSLVKWEWDFNAADGLWWDTRQVPDAGEGAVGMNTNVSYPDAGVNISYTVTLRVTDNKAPTPQLDTDTATVSVTSGNVPPVAVTNGPWSSLPGQTLTFDGTASYDPNACAAGGDPKCLNDSIVNYQWDLNGNGIYGEPEDGTPVTPGDYRIVTKSFASPVSLPATLKVTDSKGLVGTSTASFNIISIALVYGQKYEICYKTALNRYQERQGIQVRFKNFGNSTADNLKMTLTQLPTNLTVSNNRSFSVLGTLGAGEEKVTACDPTGKTADIELIFDRRIVPSNDWRWRGEFDVGNSHYTVDNIPPLAP